MVVALVTAGGVGKRFNSQIPKQFLCVNDKPILVYTLEKMEKNPNIDKIIVACLDGWEAYLHELKEKYNITKLSWISKNGSTQPESIRNCVMYLEPFLNDSDIVLIHAGNRPMVTDEIIDNSIKTCIEKGNSVASISCPEVIVDVINNTVIKRENILRVQTPQTFNYGDLKRFYEKLDNLCDVATTCDLAIKLGEKINFIHGSSNNLKITYKEDIRFFETLLNDIKN